MGQKGVGWEIGGQYCSVMAIPASHAITNPRGCSFTNYINDIV
jgi:hypothetical protein|tara:strand:- start:1958 stop:2086 length:129 start_codon:yes stop_codon:yes gene_type:complete